MARTANKSRVDQGMACEFCIREKDVLRRANFGSFEIIKAKSGMMFKTYTGFHVWTTPYAVGLDGKARPKNLYAWLDNLLNFSDEVAGHEKENFGDSGLTIGDIFDAMKTLTEANLIAPVTAFVDEGRAQEKAMEYMSWLYDMQTALGKTMSEQPPEDDAMANAEADAKREELGYVADMAADSLKADNG